MSSDYELEDTIFLPFTTRAFATGVPTVLAGTPAIDIYEDAGTTQVIVGETLVVDFDAVVGLNMVTITATAATGFELGKSYTVIIQAGTVDSVSVVGEVVAHFTLGMSAAAKDLANVTDGLSALKTLIDALNDISTADVNTQADLALSDINLDHLVGTASGIPALPAGTYFDLMQDDGVATYDRSTDSLQAVRDNQAAAGPSAATIADLVWDTDATGRQTAGTFGQAIGDPGANTETMYDAVVTDAAGINVAADIITVDGIVDTILTDTDVIDDGTSGLVKIASDVAAVLADTGTDGVVLKAAGLNADAAAEIADKVWDTDATGRQTAGTFGQAIGDPAANTETMYDAVVTDAAGTNVAADVIAVKGVLPAALSSGNMKSDVLAISTSTDAADKLEASAEVLITGLAETGTLSTTVMTSNLGEATDDHFIGRTIIWTSGVLLGQASDITDYAGVNGTVTYTAVTEAPSNGDSFVIV